MHRINKEELYKFLNTQKIPKVDAFGSLTLGRPQMFQKSIEESSKIDGLYCEFGVMSGGTTNTIASLIPDKTLYGFDSFKGITEDYSEIHKKGTWIFGVPPYNLNPPLKSNIKPIVGYYQNTLESFLNDYKNNLAFAHMSSSIYSSTKYVLDTFAKNNRFQIGTILQFDTIFYTEGNYWYQDEFKALNEIKEKYNIETEYLCWAGFCHCAYKIIKL